MVSWILKKILGSKNQREVKRLWPLVERVNQVEAEYQKLTDEELRKKTAEFRKRLADGTPLDDLLPEAFAAVKNTCRRLCGKEWPVRGQPYKWDMIPFDVQILGGIVLHQGYGLTEASPIVTTTALSPTPPRPGSIGRPLPGVTVRLVGEDGVDVLAGDPGEIWVEGPNVFPGYWHDAAATAAVLDAERFLHTGDVAVADDDGSLWLVDRRKDLIIVSGFNVYPAEVEDVLAARPDVREAAAIGTPSPRTGETVVAFVVREPGADPDPDELIAHCARTLARYKCPTRVEFVDALPRTPAGKLLRRALLPR